MTSIPTQELIREFWEWCGFRQLPLGNKYYHFEATKKVMDWQLPDGSLPRPYLPALNLDNLFRYAISKLQYQVNLKNIKDGWHCMLFSSEKEPPRIEATNKDPALALFWAIWEVIHSLNKEKGL